MIELQEVAIHAGPFRLRNISFRLDEGAYVVLMGKTGEGKTTILEAICGLRRVAAGRVILDGTDVTSYRPADRGVGYVPQDGALFPTMTVRQHLEFSLQVRHVAPARIRERVGQLADWLRIAQLLDRRIQGLSGGESQRVALGRALAFEPRVLLLDEPLSALDETTREEMQALLRTVGQQTRATVLHVTHNRNEAESLADRILVLEQGNLANIDKTTSAARA